MFYKGYKRIQFSPRDHIRTYIPGAGAAVNDLMNLLTNIGAEEKYYILVPEHHVLAAMDALAPILVRIAQADTR
jgi:hypothetical protein